MVASDESEDDALDQSALFSVFVSSCTHDDGFLREGDVEKGGKNERGCERYGCEAVRCGEYR